MRFHFDFRGLWYLHSTGIVHGDVKPQNILVSKDLRQVKLCDFGVSRLKLKIRETQTALTSIQGTFYMMAPETFLRNIKPNFQTDIWCTRATVEIFLQRDCWTNAPDGMEDNDFIKACMEQETEPHGMAALKAKHNDIYDIVCTTMCYDADARTTAKQLYEAMNA